MQLPVKDFVIAGSGPLFVRGWISDPHDLDIVARGSAWQMSKALGAVQKAPYSTTQHVQLFDGNLEVLDGWFPEIWPVDELINTADIIDGIRFMALNVVLETKLMMGRERDLEHVEVLHAHGY
ncbi:hypothetical protein GCM10010172_49470 [Paractinoplanes ferrugineus]|uniref:Uncharacterized protein n=1 Tax=Paractinoplanes ferrugineus TaxID=113564 RepID=A0A919J777_9ACTN|nr:hypothetical protein [Actinoplanes ferrugineus]GIE15790.1 hypothetical protein Afe05nite_76300 [Actinoplanes ferrugineus]